MPTALSGQSLLRLLALAAVYATLGLLAVLLAVPPGYSAPIYPSAGVALAVLLVHGPLMAIGVFVGAFTVNAHLMLQNGATPGQLLGLPLAAAAGAAAQAWLGSVLVRRSQRGPLRLSEPRELLRFFLLGGVVACLLNASLANVVMTALGMLAPEQRAFNWWSWWSGDTLGVLIAAPVTLTLIGQPRSDWAPRRSSVALPLLGAALLLALTTVLVSRWETQRLQTVFERDANSAAEALQDRLLGTLHALEATRGLFVAHDSVTAAEFGRATAPWFRDALPIQALGFVERLPRGDIAAHEARVRAADGRSDFRVFDRRDATGGSPATDADQDALVIRYIAPEAGNVAALGLNLLSVPAARRAVLLALSSRAPAATEGFRLTQETADQTGIVVYSPLPSEAPKAGGTARARPATVFVTLRMQRATDAAMADSARYLHWCLTDRDPSSSRPLLAGRAGCAADPSADFRLAQDMDFAGRHWRLVLSAERSAVPGAGNGNAWLFSSVGLAATALLAALLLTVTGRARRIEAAVAERTADLQHEVAERQRTEAALRESEQRLRNIFDQAPLGIAYTDLDGRVSESNPRLREMLGYSGEALAEHRLVDLAVPEDRDDARGALARLAVAPAAPVSRRLRLRHRDGSWLWVQMNWSVLRDPAGRPQRLVAVVEDITDHLRREEAEQGRQVAESANRAKNEFLSRMSHELRTPLNAMLGFAQLLDLDRRPELAPHQSGWTGHILQAGWHLLEMINDILDLSRIEAGMLRLDPAPVPLAPLVDHCLTMVAQPAAQRAIGIEVRLAADADVALGDETRVKQVLTNLLSNAVKYNADGGQVRVTSQRLDPARLQIRVSDTGPGMSAAQLANLFQPFNRLGREQGDVEGTGIGLVISRRLAEWMGGSLEAESTVGQGATLVLTLPAGSGTGADAATRRHDEADPALYRRRDVLYIEDNDTNAEVMRGVLDQRPQVRLTVAATGREGLATARRRRPDLVLMDMHLPDVDGLDLLHQLRSEPGLADVPVLVVSADATPTRVDEALAAGALHYLTKPLNLSTFLSAIDQALEDIDTQFDDLPDA